MNCPYCQYPNPKENRFCENCGAPLPEKKAHSHTGLIIALVSVILLAAAGITVILVMSPKPSKHQPEQIAEAENETQATEESDEIPTQTEETIPETKSTPETDETELSSVSIKEPLTLSLTDIRPDDLSSYVQASAVNASASSTISQSGYDNSALALIDDQEETSWQEGVNGSGIGEYVEIQYADTYQVKYIAFKLGNWRDNDYFFGNNRPETLTLTLNGETSYTVNFPKHRSVYYLEFSSPVPLSHLKLTIDEVYAGEHWDDTCIAEITAYAEAQP